MRWLLTWRADPELAALADRHYSRRTVGAVQFAPPGPVVCLISDDRRAGWVSWKTSYPSHEALIDAWSCTFFRNEGDALSSELIIEALAVTRRQWPGRTLGCATFVDPAAIRSSNPGACFKAAGFRTIARTKGGHGRPPLLCLTLAAELLPDAADPLATLRPGAQFELGAAL